MKFNVRNRFLNVSIILVCLISMVACAPNLERLINDLDNSSEQTRRRSAEKLGDLGDPKAVDALISALSDQDYLVRINAIQALGKIGDPKAVEPLMSIHWLHRIDNATQEAVEEALVAMGEPAVPELITYLANADVFVSHEQNNKIGLAITVLAKIRDTAIDDLIDALGNEELQVGAATVLKRIGYVPPKETDRLRYYISLREEDGLIKLGAIAVEPLIKLLEDEDVELRKFAIKILGEIGDPQAVEPLIEAYHDPDEYVRWTTVIALGKIGSADAIQAIITAFDDQKVEVRDAALDELVQIGEPAIEPLTTQVLYPGTKYRLLTLGEIGGQQVIEFLMDIINSSDESLPPSSKYYAAIALVMASDNDASVLFPLLQNKDTVWVYRSMIELGREETEDELIEALNKFGDEDMANVYLNCGNSRLESAASTWAYQHGYSVVTLQGGSSGGQWGGSK